MPNHSARHTVQDLGKIMETLDLNKGAASLKSAMNSVGHRRPTHRHIERMYGHGLLMSEEMTKSMIDGLKKYAANSNIDTKNCNWGIANFDYSIVDFSNLLAKEQSKPVNATRDLLEEIAQRADLPTLVIRGASSGKCTDLPKDAADQISIAAQAVLQLAAPLEVTPYLERKPIGGVGAERGAYAYQCRETSTMRRSLLKWTA